MGVKYTSRETFPSLLHKLDGFGEYIAKVYYEKLLENIASNKFGFTLSDSTLSHKKGFAPLIDSGAYVKAIKLDGSRVYVSDGTHPTGISFADLSNILEFGRMDKHIMPFPVWSLTLDEIKNDLPKYTKAYFNS